MDDGIPSPLEPDELDEVLSAELDGELDALARDLGTDVDALTARVRATPGAASRRTALAAARDLFSEPPPLDELSAARLRDAAVRAAEHDDAFRSDLKSRRRNRRLLSLAGAAAAIAAIAGLAVGLGSGLGSNDNAKSSSAPVSSAAGTAPRAPTAPSDVGPVTALGAFTDQRALGQAAVARGEAVRSTATTKSPVDTQKDSASGPTTTAGRSPEANKSTVTSTAAEPSAAFASGGTTTSPASQPKSAEIDRGLAARAASTCAAPPPVPVRSRPILRATATLAGDPVVVLVYAESNGHIVVIEDTHCTLLHLQMLG